MNSFHYFVVSSNQIEGKKSVGDPRGKGYLSFFIFFCFQFLSASLSAKQNDSSNEEEGVSEAATVDGARLSL
jgi:hypothetical protein